MPIYSIKDLENLTGIQAHTIRIWEQRYGLLSPNRTPTNIRRYSDKELRKLLSVALLNNNGWKISKIAKMSDAEVTDLVLRLTEGEDVSVENQIETLKMVMVEMSEEKFDKVFSHLVLQLGFEETIYKIFIPFFKRLTYLWQTDAVTIAQINFMTSLYRQKMYVAIDGIVPQYNPNKKSFIMFLPQTEWLDIGLLFCNYMAKKRGHFSLYLGASFPAKELLELIPKYPNSYLLSVATLSQINLTKYYNQLLEQCNNGQKILVTGNQIDSIKIEDGRLTTFQDYSWFQNLLDGKV